MNHSSPTTACLAELLGLAFTPGPAAVPPNLQDSSSLILQLERQLQDTQRALHDTQHALQTADAECRVRGELCQSLAAEREVGQQSLLEAQAAHKEAQAQASSHRQQVERDPT